MKKTFLLLLASALSTASLFLLSFQPKGIIPEVSPEPWSAGQLMAPVDLQSRLTDAHKPAPLVLSIGPGAVIKGSEDLGAAHEEANMKKFRDRLAALPRNTELVIYCGCCPFEHCPNIRPAFSALNEMKFSNAKLLNIEHNIKTDWISKGYLTSN